MWWCFNPQNLRAQAFELIEREQLEIEWGGDNAYVWHDHILGPNFMSEFLPRAICLAVIAKHEDQK